MAKLLRPLIIIVLLLAVGALVMEVLLFNQREPLKGRADKHQQASVRLAERLNAAIDPHIPRVDEQLDGEALLDYTRMDSELDRLHRFAVARLDLLEETAIDLKETQDTLAETERTLARTQRELEDARAEIRRLEGVVAERDRQLTAANRRIDGLENEKRGLEQEVAALKTEIEEKDELITTQSEEIEFLNAELSIYRVPGQVFETPELLSGEIVHVENEWSFVVINIGRADRLSLGSPLLVHRGEEYIGRVRVTSTDEHLSIGAIVLDQMKVPFEPGDKVFFTRML
jgi:myosin heavy subunit